MLWRKQSYVQQMTQTLGVNHLRTSERTTWNWIRKSRTEVLFEKKSFIVFFLFSFFSFLYIYYVWQKLGNWIFYDSAFLLSIVSKLYKGNVTKLFWCLSRHLRTGCFKRLIYYFLTSRLCARTLRVEYFKWPYQCLFLNSNLKNSVRQRDSYRVIL